MTKVFPSPQPSGTAVQRLTHSDQWLGRVLMGGLLLSGGFLVEGAGAARLYTVAVGIMCGFVLLAAALALFSDARPRHFDRDKILPTGLKVLLGVFALIWIVRMVLDYREMGLTGFGLKIAAAYATHGLVIFTLIQKRYFRTPSDAVMGIVIAVTIYGAANLLADALSIGADQSMEMVSRFQSRFAYTSHRWLPPLAISNGSFSMLFAFAICTALRFLVHVRLPEYRTKCLLMALLLPVLIWCSVKVQFRATLLVAMTGLVWTALPMRLKPVLDLGLILSFPLVSLTYIGLKGADMLQWLVPAEIIEASGSSPEMFYTFSGRGYIWDYGYDLLASPSTFLWGDGPAMRDATPGILAAGIGMDDVGMTIGFHHSFVELLVAHGVFAALLVMGSLWFVALRLSGRLWRLDKNDSRFPELLTIFIPLGAVAAGSQIDGPLGYFPILMLMLLPTAFLASE